LFGWLVCSSEESEYLTNDELADGEVIGRQRHNSQPMILLGCDTGGHAGGDVSCDELYSEINAQDTERLLKTHTNSKTRRSNAANSESSSCCC